MKSLTPWRLILLLFALGAASAYAGVTARVDREHLSLSESLQLTIRVSGSLAADAPDLAVLEQDFEVLERSRSSSFSIGGGQRETATEWQITLAPRRSGQLQIPSLAIDGEKTDPITVTVDADPAAAAGSGDVRLEVEADADELHVQQQLLVSVRVLHAVNLERGATLEPLVIDGAIVSELGENTHTRTIGGRRFAVFERRYAVFPQRSGELLIPSIDFRAAVGRAGGGWFDQFGARAIRLRSQEKQLRVLPPVDQATPWLPARVLTLVETWDKDPQQLRAGDSATRTVTLNAHGLTAAQLPSLQPTAIPGLRFYPDQPRLEDTPGEDGITGTRTESAAVIPEHAGTFVLPPVELRWWDTVNRRFETALIPERTIEIQAAAAGANTPTAQAAPSRQSAETDPAANPTDASGLPGSGESAAANPSLPWMFATLLFALSTLFTGWQWRRAVRSPRPSLPAPPTRNVQPDEDSAFATLQAACASADLARIRTALRAWGVAAFPDRHILSASDALEAIADATVTAEYERLLANAYRGDTGPTDAAGLLAGLAAHRTRLQGPRESRNLHTGDLPPLYPHGRSA